MSRVEELEAKGPYGLVVAGESLHWMEWSTVMKRFGEWLVPRGFVAIVIRGGRPSPWSAELGSLISEYSTNRDFRAYDLVEELTSRQLFNVVGQRKVGPEPFQQSVEDYIRSFHSRNGFSAERMGPGRADEFDARMRDIIRKHQSGGRINLEVTAEITWGRPA